MTDSARTEEAARLAELLSRLEAAIAETEQRLRDYDQDIREQKAYLWGNRGEMDHVEKIAQREAIQQTVSTGDAALALKQRPEKLRGTSYFGRFDFARGREDGRAGSTSPARAPCIGLRSRTSAKRTALLGDAEALRQEARATR